MEAKGKHNKGRTKHGNNQPSRFSRQNIMASAIITETYSQIMAVCMKMRIYVCVLRGKDTKRKQGQAAGCMRGFFLFALREMLSERADFYPLSQKVPHYNVGPLCLSLNQCTTQKMT